MAKQVFYENLRLAQFSKMNDTELEQARIYLREKVDRPPMQSPNQHKHALRTGLTSGASYGGITTLIFASANGNVEQIAKGFEKTDFNPLSFNPREFLGNMVKEKGVLNALKASGMNILKKPSLIIPGLIVGGVMGSLRYRNAMKHSNESRDIDISTRLSHVERLIEERKHAQSVPQDIPAQTVEAEQEQAIPGKLIEANTALDMTPVEQAGERAI